MRRTRSCEHTSAGLRKTHAFIGCLIYSRRLCRAIYRIYSRLAREADPRGKMPTKISGGVAILPHLWFEDLVYRFWFRESAFGLELAGRNHSVSVRHLMKQIQKGWKDNADVGLRLAN